MHTRFRGPAALFALIAFSLFWVEGVWASMCLPGMEMDATTEMVAETEPPAELCAPGMAVPSGEPESDPDQSSDGPHCPLTMGLSSCTAGLPLSAESVVPVVPSPGGTSLVGSPDHAKDLLLAVALFHPPRA